MDTVGMGSIIRFSDTTRLTLVIGNATTVSIIGRASTSDPDAEG